MGDADGRSILYRDEVLAAECKPSGLAVHRGWARDPTYALNEVRDLLGQWVYPVHRLDRATSGVLVFALDRETARRVQAQFTDGRVEKRYLALVRGGATRSRRTPRGDGFVASLIAGNAQEK